MTDLESRAREVANYLITYGPGLEDIRARVIRHLSDVAAEARREERARIESVLRSGTSECCLCERCVWAEQFLREISGESGVEYGRGEHERGDGE